jgi:hypothetical protein
MVDYAKKGAPEEVIDLIISCQKKPLLRLIDITKEIGKIE